VGALVAGPPTRASAQASTKDSVVAAVNQFFHTMTSRDSIGAAAVVRADGVMHSIRYQGDSTIIRASTNASYLAGVAQRAGLVERLWNPTVLIHKDLATVWAPYDFVRGGTFSHCGVDVFLLAREAGRWRLLSAAYTVEPTGCPPAPPRDR
jgi:hypothetical protein